MKIKIKKPKLLYMLFFAVASPFLVSLLFAPLAPIFIFGLLMNDISHLDQQLLFPLYGIGLPLLIISGVYMINRKIKNPYIFFGLVFVIFLIFSNIGLIADPLRFFLPKTEPPLFIVTIGLHLYTSAVLTYFWKKIFLQQEKANYLIIPLLLVFTVALLEYAVTTFFNQDPLLNLYISTGEYLKNFGVNIFYLDFGGFVGVLLNLIASTSALITAKLNAKVKKIK